MAAMSKPLRTNRAYKVDSPLELLVIVCRLIKWIIWQGLRFRTEVGLVSAILSGYFWVDSVIGPDLAGMVLLCVSALAMGPDVCRSFILARLRCSRTRRAIKAMSREEKINNTLGKPPLVIRSRRTDAGERYTLLLRVGQSAEMIEGRRDGVRAATHARDVRIKRNPNRAHIVTLDVIRRDALAGAAIESPLVELVGANAVDS